MLSGVGVRFPAPSHYCFSFTHARDFHRIDPFQQGPVEVGPPVLVLLVADGSGRMSLKAWFFWHVWCVAQFWCMVFNLPTILKLQNTCIWLGINFLKFTNSRDDVSNLIHQLDPSSTNKWNARNKWAHPAVLAKIITLRKMANCFWSFHPFPRQKPPREGFQPWHALRDSGIRSVHFLMQQRSLFLNMKSSSFQCMSTKIVVGSLKFRAGLLFVH